MSSKKRSDDARPFDWKVPTTAADILALRRGREERRPWPLGALNLLAPSRMFPVTVSRPTPGDAALPFRLCVPKR